MYAYVDFALCEGCGACAEAYPLMFEMRDDKAWVVDGGGVGPGEADAVARLCPFGAISMQ